MGGLLGGGGWGIRLFSSDMRAVEGRLHAISKTRRELRRPLGNGLRVDADRIRSLGYRASKQANGFVFSHAPHVRALTD